MFHNIPPAVLERMTYLEAIDARDRRDDTVRMQRLRQVPPETGRLLAILLACAPADTVLKIGASGGYSGLWLSLACRLRGDQLVTFEVLETKAALARETFEAAGVQDLIHLIGGDARAHLAGYPNVAFCFIDAEKAIYLDCYDLVAPNLVPGGLILADNAISHQEELKPFLERVREDPRLDALIVPIGKGLLVCRKV